MATLLLTHPVCIEHEPPLGHPERPDRLRAINAVLSDDVFADLQREEAPASSRGDLLRAHEEKYVAMVEKFAPKEDREPLDADTWMSPKSLEAAYRAVGASLRAVDAVFAREVDNAFCAVRPPGHHAERNRAMGFCLFNAAAVAAYYARARHGAERVAVIDFDVHHGNGTQDIFWSDRDLFYGSTHQMPLYPGTGAVSEIGAGNIWNAPLRPGDGSQEFRNALRGRILAALEDFHPDLIIVSAGFDAHRNDPLGNLELDEADFTWATLQLMDAADRLCGGRLVSTLEGGYDLRGLAGSVAVHVQALMRGTGDIQAPPLKEVSDGE